MFVINYSTTLSKYIKRENEVFIMYLASEVDVFFCNNRDFLWCSEESFEVEFLHHSYQKIRRTYTITSKKIVETMADADGHNSIPQHRIASNDGAIESRHQGLHFPRVGFSIVPAVEEIALENDSQNISPPSHRSAVVMALLK